MIYISNLKKWISPDERLFTTKILFRKSTNGDSYEAKEGFFNLRLYYTWLGYFREMYNDNSSFLFSLTKG